MKVPSRMAVRTTTRSRFAALAAWGWLPCFALTASPAGAATTLYITNHVQSNQIGRLTTWQGNLAASSLGGVVFADPVTGNLSRILRSQSGLPSNLILAVAATPSGSLWAGTADHGIARLKPDGTFRRTLTSFDGLPSDRVQALYVHGDSIWVGTGGGVALFTETAANGQIVLRRSDTHASTAGGLVGDNVLDFRQLGDTVWCATTSGLSTFAGGAWQNRAGTLGVSVQALEVHEDTLWAATLLGPRRYDSGAFTLVAAGYGGGTTSLTSAGGFLVSGSAGSGAYRYTGTGWAAMGSTGLPSVRVNSLELAPDGRLWAGTDQGLARDEVAIASPASWTAFLLPGPAVNTTQRAVADARGVWFATGNAVPPGGSLGDVLHYDGHTWSTITHASTGGSLQSSSVFAILSDKDGKLWFGHCCSPTDPKPRTERWDPATDHWDTLGVTNLFTLAQAPSGLVYGGSVELGNGVYVFNDTTAAVIDSLTTLNTQGSAVGAGLASNNLRGIAFDPTGRGWFAHAASALDLWDGRGTLDHSDDIWNHLSAGFPSFNQTTCVVTTGPTSGWVGTPGGVVRISGDRRDPVASDATNAALPSLLIQDLAVDSGGNVWIATAGGLARVDAATDAVEHWGGDQGLAGDDVRSLAWDARKSELWVGTVDGISEVLPVSGGTSAIDQTTYVFPNPLGASASALRIGGIHGAVSGEVRDLTGAVIRRFQADPTQDRIWDLTTESGARAAAGVYLVFLRDGGHTRSFRVAVIR
jgi:ligand-binding sensor domain-containing protein